MYAKNFLEENGKLFVVAGGQGRKIVCAPEGRPPRPRSEGTGESEKVPEDQQDQTGSELRLGEG